MSELMQLIEQEIPEGRQNLQENFNNLEKVAQYCQENYIQAKDKKKALEETKNFTTHSLASVAYQINNLATNFLKLLDLQQNQLAEMESNVNHLAQTVNIHKEKVARREIGVLTTNRTTTRPLGVKNGIIFPEHGERPTKYQRKNIDYTLLDDIGHGVKSPENPEIYIRTGPSVQSGPSQSRSSSISSGSSQAPTQQPPTPPQLRGSQHGSIGRASGQQIAGNYRTPAPMVAPPTVPGGYASREQLQRGSPYMPSVVMGQAKMPSGMMQNQSGLPSHPPPLGVARPMSQSQGGAMPPPPPPPGMPPGDRTSQLNRQTSVENLPPPPPDDENPLRESQQMSFDEGSNLPLPPPQFDDDQDVMPMAHEEDPYAATGPDMFTTVVPEAYVEKVIAIYDYAADKEDELTFTENSVIYVLKKNDDGWYEGVLNGQTGLFPGNYVEPCI
ncbi:abl interactor 2-like isoform X2 [Ruditapes philippinarum]|uniref:abl interactor 2-like isoform X2 n=1 Tax=Ruditapes philippinarum TaxID=129788 RepID=UPI00295BA194|nr:abl interactor 2-like isoform X2 [Ruditapes philippinarum]